MSLVTTARLSSVPSSRQSRAISELLPVPTGPATPRRRARPGAGWDGRGSGTEEPPFGGAVLLAPLLEQRGGGRGERVQGRQAGHGPHQPLDLGPRRYGPGHVLAGVEGDELERGREHGLD